jgi:hypothetical protein
MAEFDSFFMVDLDIFYPSTDKQLMLFPFLGYGE